MLDAIERFLAQHSRSSDLGLRLDGEQLAAGVRFIRIAKEGTYDVVVGNPPYQGTSKMANAGYVAKQYPRGKADLYAAFLERAVELARPGGMSAMLTMRGWMFLGQFAELRKHMLTATQPILGDLGWGAFEIMTDNPVTMSVLRRHPPRGPSVAISPTDPTARVRTDTHRRSIIAGLLAQVGRHEFDPRGFEVIEGEPIVYWWTKEFLARYAAAPKLATISPIRQGMPTSNNARYVRSPYELSGPDVNATRCSQPAVSTPCTWAPYIKGEVDPIVQTTGVPC